MNRDFKGVWIPKEIWLDARLNALEKVILAEIDSLDTTDGGCFASNQYLAEFCGCSDRKVSDAVGRLVSFGLLEVVSFDGRTRRLKSNIASNLRGRVEKSARQSRKICEADSQNLPPINIDINTNNIEKRDYREKSSRFSRPTLEEIKQYIIEQGYAVDAERFFNYYESNGWKVGRNNPMKDWKAAVRNWNKMDKTRSDKIRQNSTPTQKNSWNDYPQREYDFDDLEMKLFKQFHGKE